MNTNKTILDRAIDALEDYLNAGHKELRRQAAEKAKKVYEDYYGTPYKNREEVKASLKKDKRQQLIDSLPEWLRERADELLIEDAFDLGRMYFDWFNTHEGSQFWMDCANGEFDYAIARLRANNPEVYQKHYARFFPKEERIYVPDSIKIGFGAIINGDKRLYYSRHSNDWFVCLEPSEDTSMQRPYLEKVEELQVGKVYYAKWENSSFKGFRTGSLLKYCIYLRDGSFVSWDNNSVREFRLTIEAHTFYEVKDDNS